MMKKTPRLSVTLRLTGLSGSQARAWFTGLLAAGALGLAGTASAALNDTGIDFCGDATTNTADCATVAADGGAFPLSLIHISEPTRPY